MTDRFAHRLKLDSLHDGERVELVADEAERKSVAERLGLTDLGCLQAHATLTCKGALIEADGRIVASLAQTCVVTGVPVPAHVDEAFSLIFIARTAGQPVGRGSRAGPRRLRRRVL
jgi:hypothetical protein